MLSYHAIPKAMRLAMFPLALAAIAACHTQPDSSYLFLWAGDSAQQASDFLAVVDANPSSAHYGSIVTSLATGVAGAHPHHTEAAMPADDHLLANGFHAGRTWLFDLTQPLHPQILASFGDVAGFSHPHTYVRLTNGNVLATFQYAADSAAPVQQAAHTGMAGGSMHTTGGLVEMDERGRTIRSASAHDPAISDTRIFPYSVLPLPAVDRAVSTTTDMDASDSAATSEWVQFWRLSDLKLLKSIALAPGPRGDENRFTGEPRLLPDGKSVYIHTFNCGLYLLREVDGTPNTSLVHTFDGKDCGVPILAGHYWLQTVPDAHALVAMDVSDPARPREVSTITFGNDERPHWIALDPTGHRIVLNSAGGSKSNRLFIVNFDPSSGALTMDERFRDAGAGRPGVDLTGKTWPHGFTGRAAPHGTVFSR